MIMTIAVGKNPTNCMMRLIRMSRLSIFSAATEVFDWYPTSKLILLENEKYFDVQYFQISA